MSVFVEPTEIPSWTPDEISSMSKEQLLEAIWRIESLCKEPEHQPDPISDHRRFLSRAELENVVRIGQRLAQMRMPPIQADL